MHFCVHNRSHVSVAWRYSVRTLAILNISLAGYQVSSNNITYVMNALTWPEVGVATQKFSGALGASGWTPLSKFLDPPLNLMHFVGLSFVYYAWKVGNCWRGSLPHHWINIDVKYTPDQNEEEQVVRVSSPWSKPGWSAGGAWGLPLFKWGNEIAAEVFISQIQTSISRSFEQKWSWC